MPSPVQSPLSDVPSLDPFELVGIKLNPCGTLSRPTIPDTPAVSDPDAPVPLLSKDILVNPSSGTWFRILLPRDLILGGQLTEKLPLVVFYHGGGFILFSAVTSVLDNFFEDLALLLPAVIVSVEYRPAPEHRLPAAYDDALEALEVIRTTKEEWLTTYADLSNCYLMGGSAGGNIAYNVGLRIASSDVNNLKPLNIRGLILIQPFFGGMKRTESELRLFNDKTLPLVLADLMWELSLPVGEDRDHEYCNPIADGDTRLATLEKARSLGWRVLVTGYSGDPLIDRQIEFVKVLGEKGMSVASQFSNGYYHGVELFDQDRCKILVCIIKDFMSATTLEG